MAIKTVYTCDVCGKMVEKKHELTQLRATIAYSVYEAIDADFLEEIKNTMFVSFDQASEFVRERGYEKYIGKLLTVILNQDDVYQIKIEPRRKHKKVWGIDVCETCLKTKILGLKKGGRK